MRLQLTADALRPAWRRFLLTLPFATLLGITIAGVLARRGVPGVGLWLVCAVPALTLVTFVLQALTVRALNWSDEGAHADLVGLCWDVVVGGLAGRLLAPMLKLDTLPAIGVGSAILAMQSLLIEKFVIGNLLGDMIGGFLMPSGTKAEPEYSLAASMAARGDYDGARAEYERQFATNSDPRPLIHLARMQRNQQRAYAEAAQTLERVLALPKIDFGRRTAVVRELCELYRYKLHEPGHAITVLAKYVVENRSRGGEVEWARCWIKDMKQP